MNPLKIAQNIIEILNKMPFDSRKKLTINLLERFIKVLNGEKNVIAPTKEELKTAVDIIKELKEQNALTYEEYNNINMQAEFCKLLIEWSYKHE